VRGVFEARRLVGSPAPLRDLRPCRLLRLIKESARHQTLQKDKAPHHAIA